MGKPSQTQLEAMNELLRYDGKTDAPSTLGRYRELTIRKLRIAHWVDYELSEPYTFAHANRPRRRYYKLTQEGRQIVLAARKAKQERYEALMSPPKTYSVHRGDKVIDYVTSLTSEAALEIACIRHGSDVSVYLS